MSDQHDPQGDDANSLPAPTAVAVLEHVVRSIVDDPDAVKVSTGQSRGNKVRLEVSVGPGDLGWMSLLAGVAALPIPFITGTWMDKWGRKRIIVPSFLLLAVTLVESATGQVIARGLAYFVSHGPSKTSSSHGWPRRAAFCVPAVTAAGPAPRRRGPATCPAGPPGGRPA